MDYDSKPDTEAHILRVQQLLFVLIGKLAERANQHDKSKLESPKKEIFDRVTPRLKALTYGSDEYKASLTEMKPALDHHYAKNSHHPEHYPLWKCGLCQGVFSEHQIIVTDAFLDQRGAPMRFCPSCCSHGTIFEATVDPYLSVDGMSLLDLLEMLCDWKAAGERHADGSMARSLEINKKRFNISTQLQSVLENSVKELGWI
jgi:hypothetical protein